MGARPLSLVAALAAVCLLAVSAPARTWPCDSYRYAGFQSPSAATGVAATVTLLAAPRVRSGHVAGWVGVGGIGLGPGGSDAWVQVGISGYPGGRSELYYEYHLPRRAAPRYVSLGNVDPGDRVDVSVVESSSRENAWRVVVDGVAVGAPIVFGGRTLWRPIATAENWDGDTGACNGFAYGFSGLEIALRRGSDWRPFELTHSLRDDGLRLRTMRAGFIAAAP